MFKPNVGVTASCTEKPLYLSVRVFILLTVLVLGLLEYWLTINFSHRYRFHTSLDKFRGARHMKPFKKAKPRD